MTNEIFSISKEEEEDDDEGVQGHQKVITKSKVKGQEDEVVEGQLEKEQQKTDQPTETRDKTFLTEVSGVTNKSRVTIVTPSREDTRQGKVYFIPIIIIKLILTFSSGSHTIMQKNTKTFVQWSLYFVASINVS